MKRTATFVLILFVSAAGGARAEVIAAASCQASDVQAALKTAVAGDTVMVPAGTCHWTTGIAWDAPANAELRGAGDASLGGGDKTVIVDDFVSGAPLVRITTSATGTFRLSGLTIRGGTGSLKEGGVIAIHGATAQLRVDHLHIDMQAYTTPTASKPMRLTDVRGVIDHIVVDLAKQGHILVAHENYGGASSGDGSWAAPSNFGSPDFVFLEDSQFNASMDPGGLYLGTVTDCNGGGRMVLRYNAVVGAGFAQTHPTGGAARGRGCRAHEVYGNTASASADFDPLVDQPPFAFSWMSSGTSLVWGNTSTGTHKHFIALRSMRASNETYPQQATPMGWGYCGRQFSGSGSKWDGSSTTLTGYPCLDQPGRGQGDLLTGQFPNAINTTTGTISWPNQTLEPVREWLNTFTAVKGWGNDTHARVVGASSRLASDRDFYTFTSSFTGTSGVGAGPRASRPAACTPGVAYWSTDQGGNWNTINATANDGTLDVCTSVNTWSDGWYTPYTYPHPLTQSAAPGAPTNLRVVVQ